MIAFTVREHETAKKLIAVMRKENLTYSEAMNTLAICKVELGDQCRLVDDNINKSEVAEAVIAGITQASEELRSTIDGTDEAKLSFDDN